MSATYKFGLQDQAKALGSAVSPVVDLFMQTGAEEKEHFCRILLAFAVWTTLGLFVSGSAYAVPGHTITDLRILGGDSGIAHDINNAGQVVGRADCTDEHFDYHAFLWKIEK
jgi:probable HAF family extracellular repeat protein